jgi:hypothetical protein
MAGALRLALAACFQVYEQFLKTFRFLLENYMKHDYLQTAQEVASTVNLTDRRIRQLAFEGKIKSPSRGLYDITWAIHYVVAQKAAPDRLKEQNNADLMVAWSWASGVLIGQRRIDPENLELFVSLFERNGINRDDALVTLGKAMAFIRH